MSVKSQLLRVKVSVIQSSRVSAIQVLLKFWKDSRGLSVCYYIIITIVQSYTRQYHEFVTIGIATSAQHE